MAKGKKLETIRDRIVDLRRVRASDLRPNPKNWRKHPASQQNALRGVLAEVGYVDALIARELPDGTLEIVDGHLRAETTPDTEVPVLVVDLSEAEAAKVLATFDPLSAMAEADANLLDELLREVETGSEDLAKMLTDLAEDAGILDAAEGDEDVILEKVEIPPPALTWVLLAIPTVRFGEIAEDVERMAAMPDVICETSSCDG